MSVIRHNVLKHFFLREDIALLAVAHEPESRRLMVKIIRYAEVVLSYFLNADASVDLHVVAEVVLCHVFALGENVVCV